jgi:hypothetical protein
MKRASVLFVVFGLLIVAVTPAFAQAFNLLTPTGSLLIRDVDSDLPHFAWQPVAGATDYDLSLFKVSTNPRAAIGTVFTVNVTPASCDASACYYTPTGPQYATLDTGEYAWTVIADLPSSDIEASNAPLFFSVNPAPIALLANPNFESGVVTPWVGKNLTNDKLKSGKGSGGSWGFMFNGGAGENSKLQQPVDVTYLGIDNNDSLSYTAEYKATNAAVNLRFIMKVIYTPVSGLAKDKVIVTAVPNAAFTPVSSGAFVPDGPVKKIKMEIVNQSPAGKAFVDNIQITLAGQP